MITKYNPRGEQLWTNTIAGSGGGHDFATDLDFDYSGNVVVGGSISETSGEGNNILVAKYNSSGTELWRYSHDYSGNIEGAASLAIDNDNSIYLTGATQQPSGYTDMITIKIDSTSALQWEKVLDYNGLHDAGVRIEWTGARVIVTGGGQLNSFTYKIWTIGYDPSDGSVLGTMTSAGSSPVVEEVTDLVTDQNDNIYIAGSTINSLTGNDMLLIKLDEDLNIEWTKEWDGDGMSDKGSGVRVAPNGDVYLCGTTETTSGDDIALIKFNADGDFIWEEIYSSAEGGDDVAAAMEMNDGYLYITGNTYNISNVDYLTMKYDITGTKLWEITYNSPFNKDDRATNLVIDDNGDIVVSGQSETDVEGKTTYYTVKYVEYDVPELAYQNSGQNSGFVKNMGQLYKSNDSLAFEIEYYANSGPYHLFACDTGLYMVNQTLSNDSLSNDTIVRVDLGFSNAMAGCKVYGEKLQRNYFNFYSHVDNVKERVPAFQTIYYPEVWRHIDVQIISSDYSIQITANPSSKLRDIEFNLFGNTGLSLDEDSNLVINTDLFPFVLPAPKVYQKNSQGEYEELGWSPHFHVEQNRVSLDGFGTFDLSKDLVILMAPPCAEEEIEFEPSLCYSSYFGGISDDQVSATDMDEEGNLLVAGYTGNWENFPDVNLQTPVESTGGAQIYLTKFFESMIVDYTTVIYGNSEDHLHGAVFHGDAIYGCGATWSHNLPSPGLQAPHTPIVSGNNLYSNAVVLRLNKDDGYLTWLTQLGGDDNDTANDIQVDPNSRVYVVGNCHDASNTFSYEELGGAYNEAAVGQTGFIARFHPSFELEWCTAFGGSDTDFLHCLDIDYEGNIFIAGHTYSDDLYMEEAAPDVYQKEIIDGESTYFLAKFDGTGQYEWSSYFGAGDEALGGIGWENIVVSDDGSFFFGGSTRDPSGLDFEDPGYGHFSDVYLPDQGGLWNGYSFIAHFSPSLDLQWMTLLGEGGQVSQVNTIELFGGTLVVAGTTKEADPLLHEIEPHYYQGDLPELYNNETVTAFVNVFNVYNYELQYGTMLGGPENSNSRNIGGITINNENEITIAGETRSSYYCVEPIRDGIPVNPMGNEEAYFKANNPSTVQIGIENKAGFITRFCIPELHTSVESVNAEQDSFLVFPNPVENDRIFVKPIAGLTGGQLTIFSTDGKLIHNQSIIDNTQIEIDVAKLERGMYVVKLNGNNGAIATSKFIKL